MTQLIMCHYKSCSTRFTHFDAIFTSCLHIFCPKHSPLYYRLEDGIGCPRCQRPLTKDDLKQTMRNGFASKGAFLCYHDYILKFASSYFQYYQHLHMEEVEVELNKIAQMQTFQENFTEECHKQIRYNKEQDDKMRQYIQACDREISKRKQKIQNMKKALYYLRQNREMRSNKEFGFSDNWNSPPPSIYGSRMFEQ